MAWVHRNCSPWSCKSTRVGSHLRSSFHLPIATAYFAMASPALDPVFLASRIDSLERQVADTTSKTLLLSLAHARAEARAKESDERLRQLVTLMRTVIPSTRPPPQLSLMTLALSPQCNAC